MEIDSHCRSSSNKKNRQQLDQNELLPFTRLAGQADAILTAHLLVHALDPLNCTTLSKASLDILRNEMGFQGVIITDSLVMEGLLKNCVSIDNALSAP